MKPAHLLLILALAMLATSCATVNHGSNVSGQWNWTCPGSAAYGKMELRQASDGSITGQMFDTSSSNGGRIKGSLKGNYLQFTRTWRLNEQRYHLALSSDGKELSGMFEGEGDHPVGTDFEAKRN
jgi:hypothetical protein